VNEICKTYSPSQPFKSRTHTYVYRSSGCARPMRCQGGVVVGPLARCTAIFSLEEQITHATLKSIRGHQSKDLLGVKS
jgi:hypothetical protein